MKLTMKEKARIELIQQVLAGKVSMERAVQVAGRSVRTIYRLCDRLTRKGLPGLVHGNKGRLSTRRVPEDQRKRILSLVRETYSNINDTHLAELLASREGIHISRETLRALLRAEGIAPKRKRRGRKYRQRRERKEAFGLMLQVDGSRHDWLENRAPKLTLVGAIDDATNHAWALFVPAETTWAYLKLMRKVITVDGIPFSLYSDRHSIFHIQREPTLIEQLQDKIPLTQFGRAMEEFGVNIIKAYSPQAKGRIERFWGTCQDRLVVDLRLAQATTLEDANRVLTEFLVWYNSVHAVAPSVATSVFRKKPSEETLDMVLCIKQTRVVQNDHTVSVDGLILQIPPSKSFRSLAGRSVDVLQLADLSLVIRFQDRIVACFSPAAIQRLLSHVSSLQSDLSL